MANNPFESNKAGSVGGGAVRIKPNHEKATYLSPDINIRPGKPRDGGECPNCGASHTATAQICPECGMSLGGNICTFCGHSLPAGASECPACGASREGVECPDCGTINFRNFCRSCNRPITKGGETAMAKFKAHPNYKAAEKIHDRLSILADFIDGKISASDPDIVALTANMSVATNPESENQVAGSVSDNEKSGNAKPLLKKPSLFAKLKPKTVMHKAAPRAESHLQVSPQEPSSKASPMTIEEAMRLYDEKKAEMDKLLDSILPDSDSTPEEQRDFYSVRMTVVTRKYKKLVEEPVAWICNYCGFRHNAPQECAEPWHGGRWVHETREVTYEESKLEKLE